MDSMRIQRLRKVALLVTVLCFVLTMACTAQAQKATQATISLDVADTELAMVVRMLAKDSGQNIVIADHDKLHSLVSATLTNVTLDTALKYIVESAGCTWSRQADGTYIIGGEPKVESPRVSGPQNQTPSLNDPQPTLLERPGNLVAEPRRNLKYDTLKLHNTSPVDMMWLLGAYKPEQAMEVKNASVSLGAHMPGVSTAPTYNSTPPLIDMGANLDNGEAGRAPTISGEAAQGPPPFNPRNPPAPNPANPNQPNQNNNTQSLMPDGIDYLMPYPADNSLLVKGTPEGIEELHELIKKLDIAPRQVSIKAEFVEINTSESSNLGIDWSTQHMGEVFETHFNPGGNVVFGWANGNVMANLRTQVLQNKAKLVNAPIISTLNNTPATIQISKQIPYWTSSGYYGTGNTQTTQTVNMLSIQSMLMVLPRINGDESITVTLQPQVSDQGEMFSAPDGSSQLPAVNQQTLTTTRRVMNGETIVVGGIIRKTENNGVTGIPLLKDLPIIGSLFKSVTKSTEDRELLIFLTPTIVPERSTAGTGVGIAL